MNSKFTAFSIIATMLATSVSMAEEVSYGERIPTTQELIDVLKPTLKSEKKKYRSIVFKDESRNPKTIDSQNEKPANKGASLQIGFEFDSFALTEHAVRQLHPLGMALKSADLAGVTFNLEGHTDAVGDAAYNQKLSEQRAVAIKQHLVSNYQIPSQHLNAVGFGETDLLRPQTPDDASNRRVRILGSR